MKKFFIISILLVLSGLGAGGIAVIHPAPDGTEPLTHCFGGTSSGCSEIYRDSIGGEIRYRFLNDLQEVLIDRPATETEINSWNYELLLRQNVTANYELNSVVEFDKKAVEILTEWSEDAFNIYNTWDTKTSQQKDNLQQELFRRMSIFWKQFANKLILDGQGQ